MNKAIRSTAACAVLLVGTSQALADNTVNTGYFGGVAIMGYDTVAYFTEGKAKKGNAEYSYNWLGTPWYFASSQNRDLFKSEPVKYAPQFGGYCAGEVAGDGVTVNIDPEAWRIIDGKLYLIYDEGNAKHIEAKADVVLPKAQANWPKVEGRLKEGKYY